MPEDLIQGGGFGSGTRPGLVGVEADRDTGCVRLFSRSGATVTAGEADFRPVGWASGPDLPDGFPVSARGSALAGSLPLRGLVSFETWRDFERGMAWLKKKGGDAAAFAVLDPVQQFLLQSGEAFFRGMAFPDLLRLQIDIETRTAPGYDFPNALREEDQILAIGLSDSTGWMVRHSLCDGSEKEMLKAAVRSILERDPDVIEGHNLFAFDLPYLAQRCRLHGVRFGIGRDGSEPKVRSGRFTAADRTISYPRADVFGRSVADTYFLAQIYDGTHRTLPGYGLKQVARHFGLASEDRVLVSGSRMGEEFDRDPARVLEYLRQDLEETRAISGLLSPVFFAQAQILPFSYQSVCLRGSAAKIEALLLREYIRLGRSVPVPGESRPFAGGFADIFQQGIVRPVHHCDVRSLYPSVMLRERIGPAKDEAGAFLDLLGRLRAIRLRAKAAAAAERDPASRVTLDAFQNAFKVLINSFYGYLGFDQARFGDASAAERVAARGREILALMLRWLEEHGAKPVEMDTDGVYYIPPPFAGPADREAFEQGLAAALPEGIEVEFDGVYEAMYSYKVKNYALLDPQGGLRLVGAALKSRGLELFQRKYIREALLLHLQGKSDRVPELSESYRRAIRNREWPIGEFTQTDRLQEDPETYAARRASGETPRNAAYELALASGRTYRAGDPVRYYVAGDKKRVAVHEAARLARAWNPDARDENVPYYLAKLEAIVKKFEILQKPGSGADADRDPPELPL
jgi:DNA polymerase elongation subunit (family B)